MKLLVGLTLFVLVLLPFESQAVNIQNPAKEYFVEIGGNTFPEIIMYVINDILLPLVGFVCLIFIILGGFRYITSSGNEEMAESGKKMVTNAIIGLVIIILSWVIVTVTIQATKGSV